MPDNNKTKHLALFPDNRIYSSDKTISLADLKTVSLWHILKNFPGIRGNFQLHRSSPVLSEFGLRMKKTLDLLDNGENITKRDLYQALHGIFSFLLFNGLFKLKKNVSKFSYMMTQSLSSSIEKISLENNISCRDIPFLDLANPCMYFYSKHNEKKNLLLVFMSKSNNLNMPFMLANEIIRKFNYHVCYIYNREINLSKSIKNILKQLKDQGWVESIMAITVSSGLQILVDYYSDLEFKKIINYSGGVGKGAKTDKREVFFENLAKFSTHHQCKILSVLSKDNLYDQNLHMNYSLSNVKTDYQFIESDSHGTFSISFQKDLLAEQFNWLQDD